MAKGDFTGFVLGLLIIIVVIGGFGIYNGSFDTSLTNYEKESSLENEGDSSDSTMSYEVVYVEVMGKKEVKSNRVVVTDRYVNDLDGDDNVIVISGSGKAYDVTSGTVLVDDVVVSVDENEYDVYRIDDPEKSVSTN